MTDFSQSIIPNARVATAIAADRFWDDRARRLRDASLRRGLASSASRLWPWRSRAAALVSLGRHGLVAPGRPARRPRPGCSSSIAGPAVPGARSQAPPHRHQTVRPLAIDSTAMSARGSSARTSLPPNPLASIPLLARSSPGPRHPRPGRRVRRLRLGLAPLSAGGARQREPDGLAAQRRARQPGPGQVVAPAPAATARARPRGRGRSSRRPARGRRSRPGTLPRTQPGRVSKTLQTSSAPRPARAGTARARGWPGSRPPLLALQRVGGELADHRHAVVDRPRARERARLPPAGTGDGQRPRRLGPPGAPRRHTRETSHHPQPVIHIDASGRQSAVTSPAAPVMPDAAVRL